VSLSKAKTEEPKSGDTLRDASSPIADLALTLPIFLGYHLGVIWLPVRNAADVVTRELVALADHDLTHYALLTTSIGVVYVGILALLGRGQSLRLSRFLAIAAEGIVYAFAMTLIASYVVGELRLASPEAPDALHSKFAGLVMSLGAGFYEEVAFRVVLYGLGARVLLLIFPEIAPSRKLLVRIGWAVIVAAVFSAWHYTGPFGDSFELRSFVFRWVCGLVFTAIYAFRGFAPAVWTHTLYDVWVLVL
jgi:membrane protease YdiL (CAAX protease family)